MYLFLFSHVFSIAFFIAAERCFLVDLDTFLNDFRIIVCFLRGEAFGLLFVVFLFLLEDLFLRLPPLVDY